MDRKGVGIMSSQTYVCPNCGGKGCPVCQNTGKVNLTDQEVQELQKLMVKQPEMSAQPTMDYGGIYPEPNEERKMRGHVAGVLTLVFLALVSVTGFLSWYFNHNFKFCFQLWSLIAGQAVLKPITSVKFFQEEEVKDFLTNVQKEDVKVKISPFYPLF